MKGTTMLKMYGTETCADCQRSRALLNRLGIAFEWIDISAEPDAAEWVYRTAGRTVTPLMVFPDGTWVAEPSDADLIEHLSRIDS